MNLARSSNPVLSKTAFNTRSYAATYTETMTLNGTINKSLAMLLLVIVGALYTWNMFFGAANIEAGSALVSKWIAVGGIGGFVAALVTIFKRSWAYITTPIYAALEGLFLGAISAFFEASYPGIVIQALALTFGTMLILLIGIEQVLLKSPKNFAQ